MIILSDSPTATAHPGPAPAGVVEAGRFPPGTLLGQRYRIINLLGQGGMGEVYLATDLLLAQPVALKFLARSLYGDARALNRLYSEVRLAREISHANVCRVYDLEDAGGLRFLTMEYVDGETLGSLLRRIGRLPPQKANDIALQLCAGISAAHDRGVIHRDLKPSNVMIDSHGNVRITDFGLAIVADRVNPSELASGTRAYMAPEQLAHQPVSIRSDIYSLGLVLYEVFGGDKSFFNSSQLKLGQPQAKIPPLSMTITLDAHVEHAIMHCLEPDPRNRPPSAAMVATELSGGDALDAAISIGETPVPELVARAGTRKGLSVRLALLCLAATLAGLIATGLAAPRISILRRVRVEAPDVLERIAQQTLSQFGLQEQIKHSAKGFGLDDEALRRHFDTAALYFWYRSSPQWIVPFDLVGIVSPGNPPTELPGMVTTKWDGSGRLLYLKAVPPDAQNPAGRSSELWTRLFAAAGLQLAKFQAVPWDWVPAPGWDERASWTGTYPDAGHTSIRVEAAAWHGTPVYFEVLADPAGRGTPSVRVAHPRPTGELSVLIVLFGISAFLARRNVRLGRGDRRGAFRLALFLFCGGLVFWACIARHVPDVAEFTPLVAALAWFGFTAMGFWMVYMAFEPYVRRRWPHVIIAWSRAISGRFRDPVVGGHVLIGITTGTVAVALIAIGLALAGAYSPDRHSSPVLFGTAQTIAYVIANVLDATLYGLFLLFIACFCRVFFRKLWIAAPATFLLAGAGAFVVLVPASFTPGPATVIIAPLLATYLWLLYRLGLLAAIVACSASMMLIALPVTFDLSAPTTINSILVLCVVAASAVFGFHSTLAGRPILKLDL